MTRRKWTKLRRQRPELFGMLPPFEKWNDTERSIMRKVCKDKAISVMTSWVLQGKGKFFAQGIPFALPRQFEEFPYNYYGKWTFTVDGQYVDPVELPTC